MHRVCRNSSDGLHVSGVLYIGSFPCAQLPGPVHTAQFGRVYVLYFKIFSLSLYVMYSFVLLKFVFVFP